MSRTCEHKKKTCWTNKCASFWRTAIHKCRLTHYITNTIQSETLMSKQINHVIATNGIQLNLALKAPLGLQHAKQNQGTLSKTSIGIQ